MVGGTARGVRRENRGEECQGEGRVIGAFVAFVNLGKDVERPDVGRVTNTYASCSGSIYIYSINLTAYIITIMTSPVKLYIYDQSKGLARAMSMQLLGRQMDGIW